MKGKRFAGFFRFLMLFCLIAFVVTCSFVLFLHFMEFSMQEVLRVAPVTFGNVLFITFLLWLLDLVRHKLFTERPVRRITKGLEQLTAGDFTTQIERLPDISSMDAYNEIIAYINQMAQELSGVETLRTDFVSNVSHEMKTPLAVIRNYTALLRSPGITDAERREYADAIEEASGRLSSLVSNILRLNKLENQQIFPELETFDLTEQLCTCLLAFESEWERRGIAIETALEETITVRSDPELLSLVWQNLLSNAMKFTNDGGTVGLSVREENGFAVVTVSDTGCGIDRETGRHIFEKFYQGDTSHASMGNGLGLALVKRIIDITNAEISVESEPGKGSRFTVRLPKGGI